MPMSVKLFLMVFVALAVLSAGCGGDRSVEKKDADEGGVCIGYCDYVVNDKVARRLPPQPAKWSSCQTIAKDGFGDCENGWHSLMTADGYAADTFNEAYGFDDGCFWSNYRTCCAYCPPVSADGWKLVSHD